MKQLSALEQENKPYNKRYYYHGISGERLKSFLKNGLIPNAQQAFGGDFSITDDFGLAETHAGPHGVVLGISVDQNTNFGNADPFSTDYYPEGDICNIGEAEFIVNEPSKLKKIEIMHTNLGENIIKGGKADKMSMEDIAKKHGIGIAEIEKEIKIGIGVENEHSNSKDKQKEIVMDHLVEDPKYYSDPKTGLLSKEKEAEKRVDNQDKKALSESVKRMKALAGIQEGEKSFLKNMDTDKVESANLNEADQKQFIVMEFDQEEVEPGEDDDVLYKIK